MLNTTPSVNRGNIIIPGRVISSHLRNKSLFNPTGHNKDHIEVFNKMVIQDLDKLKIKKMKDPQDI